MKVTTAGLDLAKSVFQLHGVGPAFAGTTTRRRWVPASAGTTTEASAGTTTETSAGTTTEASAGTTTEACAGTAHATGHASQ